MDQQPLRALMFRPTFAPRPPPIIPAGLQTLYAACRAIYPDQTNPLQVAALVKYWLGGPDPLDYISMYTHPGDPERDIPEHWHYVSFGLSDLHGDGRVHEPQPHPLPPDALSGFGFELTFRLKRSPEETAPPTWPAAILQALAKYVFQSENALCAGDHVSWHCPLDNSARSRIQHMLMGEDPQLGTQQTPNGKVRFVQVLGACQEELEAAQRWNGPGVVELMRRVCGPWLVTDMKRERSLFEADPGAKEAVDKGVEEEGSNLSGVSAHCTWMPAKEDDLAPATDELERGFAQISVQESEQIKATLKKGLLGGAGDKSPPPHIHPSGDPFHMDGEARSDYVLEREAGKEALDTNANPESPVLTKYLDRVQLRFNIEAGNLLPLALRGRLKHGRHFTFKSVAGELAITLVGEGVQGALAERGRPLAAHGPWLQVLMSEEDIENALEDLRESYQMDAIVLPKTFQWCGGRLLVTLMPTDVV